jgi:alcohol dehydrogenase (cytochrome c)
LTAPVDETAVCPPEESSAREKILKNCSSRSAKLQLAYSLSLASLRSNESAPIVIGNTLYVSTSWGPKYVYAIDAATGAPKWTYQPDIPDDVLQYACCDVNSRGVGRTAADDGPRRQSRLFQY